MTVITKNKKVQIGTLLNNLPQSTAKNNDLLANVITNLNHSVEKYYNGDFYRIPIKGNYFENMLYDAMEAAGLHDCMWEGENHTISKDLYCLEFGNIACKSAIINEKNGTITFSGSRTGGQKTLNNKISFTNIKRVDKYFILGRNKKTNEHKLFVFDSKLLKLPKIEKWKTTKNKNGHTVWTFSDKKKTIKIVESMSCQIWYTISINILPIAKKITYKKDVKSTISTQLHLQF